MKTYSLIPLYSFHSILISSSILHILFTFMLIIDDLNIPFNLPLTVASPIMISSLFVGIPSVIATIFGLRLLPTFRKNRYFTNIIHASTVPTLLIAVAPSLITVMFVFLVQFTGFQSFPPVYIFDLLYIGIYIYGVVVNKLFRTVFLLTVAFAIIFQLLYGIR